MERKLGRVVVPRPSRRSPGVSRGAIPPAGWHYWRARKARPVPRCARRTPPPRARRARCAARRAGRQWRGDWPPATWPPITRGASSAQRTNNTLSSSPASWSNSSTSRRCESLRNTRRRPRASCSGTAAITPGCNGTPCAAAALQLRCARNATRSCRVTSSRKRGGCSTRQLLLRAGNLVVKTICRSRCAVGRAALLPAARRRP